MTDPTTIAAEAMRESEAREAVARQHELDGEVGWAICVRDPSFRSKSLTAQIRAMLAFRETSRVADLEAMREAAARVAESTEFHGLHVTWKADAHDLASIIAAAIRALPIGGE